MTAVTCTMHNVLVKRQLYCGSDVLLSNRGLKIAITGLVIAVAVEVAEPSFVNKEVRK